MTLPMIFGYTAVGGASALRDWFVGPDRETVARELFRRNPNIKTVTTCNAHAAAGNYGKAKNGYIIDGVVWIDAMTDIRWTNRSEMTPADRLIKRRRETIEGGGK